MAASEDNINPSVFASRKETTQTVIFLPFCLFRHYGKKSTSMWEDLKRGNFTPLVHWVKQRIDLFKKYTGASLSLSSPIFPFKLVYLIDPLPESPEIKYWLTKVLLGISKDLSIDADILEVSLRDEPDSTQSYRNILAPSCVNYLKNKYDDKSFFIIIRLDSDDILLPFYFQTIKRILSFLPGHLLEYPYTLVPTKKSEETIYTRLTPFDSPTLLEFPLGIQKSLISNCQKLTMWGENNFSSVWISKDDMCQHGITQFAFPHDRIPSFLKRSHICTLKPAWIQLLHSDNEQNNFPLGNRL